MLPSIPPPFQYIQLYPAKPTKNSTTFFHEFPLTIFLCKAPQPKIFIHQTPSCVPDKFSTTSDSNDLCCWLNNLSAEPGIEHLTAQKSKRGEISSYRSGWMLRSIWPFKGEVDDIYLQVLPHSLNSAHLPRLSFCLQCCYQHMDHHPAPFHMTAVLISSETKMRVQFVSFPSLHQGVKMAL